MHSIKRLLAVMAAIVALAVLAPVVSAGTHRDFHLDKTCAEDSSQPLGYICTVTHSDFKWIPAGTDVRYLSQSDNVGCGIPTSLDSALADTFRCPTSRCTILCLNFSE